MLGVVLIRLATEKEGAIKPFREVDDVFAALDAVEHLRQLVHLSRPGEDAASGIGLFLPRDLLALPGQVVDAKAAAPLNGERSRAGRVDGGGLGHSGS